MLQGLNDLKINFCLIFCFALFSCICYLCYWFQFYLCFVSSIFCLIPVFLGSLFPASPLVVSLTCPSCLDWFWFCVTSPPLYLTNCIEPVHVVQCFPTVPGRLLTIYWDRRQTRWIESALTWEQGKFEKMGPVLRPRSGSDSFVYVCVLFWDFFSTTAWKQKRNCGEEFWKRTVETLKVEHSRELHHGNGTTRMEGGEMVPTICLMSLQMTIRNWATVTLNVSLSSR